MSRVITFSRTFPAYHPKAGEPTFFVEKIWKGIYDINGNGYDPSGGYQDYHDNHFHPMGKGLKNIHKFAPKYHTIRAGNRWKVGDKFSARVWSGKPYNSKQIIIAPDMEVKKVWDFEMDLNCIYSINGKYTEEQTDYNLALNDGLTEIEMQFWFMPNMNKPKEFKGQIICWNENINY